MNLKIKSIGIFLVVNFLISIFVVFNPELVLETEFEKIELIAPKTVIGNNKRMISFQNNGKEFDTLCVDTIERKGNQNVSICDDKNKIKSIQYVSGCVPVTFLSKNRRMNKILINEIVFIDIEEKVQIFKSHSACVANEGNKNLFYFFFLFINLSIVIYLSQSFFLKSGKK